MKRLVILLVIVSFLAGCIDTSSSSNSKKIDYEEEVRNLLSQEGLGFDKAFYEQPNNSSRDILLLDYDRGVMVTLSSRVQKSKSKGNKTVTTFGNAYSIMGDFTGWERIEEGEKTVSYQYDNIGGNKKLVSYSNGNVISIFDEVDAIQMGNSLKSTIESYLEDSPKKAYYVLNPENPYIPEGEVEYTLEAIYQGSIAPGTVINNDSSSIVVLLKGTDGTSKQVTGWNIDGEYILESGKTIDVPITYDTYNTVLSITTGLTAKEKIVTPGSYVTFGSYEQDGNTDNGKEPIVWVVLDVNDNKSLLISRYILEEKRYHGDKYSAASVCTWSTSDMRAWLNNDFYNNAFNSTQKSIIFDMTITESGTTTYDKVALLDENGLNYLPDRKWILTSATEHSKRGSDYEAFTYKNGMSSWWTRTNSSETWVVKRVTYDGIVAGLKNNEHAGVRPIIEVNNALFGN